MVPAPGGAINPRVLALSDHPQRGCTTPELRSSLLALSSHEEGGCTTPELRTGRRGGCAARYSSPDGSREAKDVPADRGRDRRVGVGHQRVEGGGPPRGALLGRAARRERL